MLAPRAPDRAGRTARARARRSREVLEHKLGTPVRAISYPTGLPIVESPRICDAVRAAGYDLGFSNATGLNVLSKFHPLDCKRAAVDLDLTDEHFLAMLTIPGLAYV